MAVLHETDAEKSMRENGITLVTLDNFKLCYEQMSQNYFKEVEKLLHDIAFRFRPWEFDKADDTACNVIIAQVKSFGRKWDRACTDDRLKGGFVRQKKWEFQKAFARNNIMLRKLEFLNA